MKIITKQTQAYKDKANIILLILSKSSGLIVFTHNGVYIDRKQFFSCEQWGYYKLVLCNFPFLLNCESGHQSDQKKISWPITCFYIAEYSTAWFSFNSFYHSLARRPWVEPRALPLQKVPLCCCAWTPGFYFSRRDLHVLGCWVDGNIIQNLNQSYQTSTNHVVWISSLTNSCGYCRSFELCPVSLVESVLF